MSWPSGGIFRSLPAVAAAVWLASFPAWAAIETGAAETLDYPGMFGASYRKAGEFVARNGAATRAFASFGIDPREAWAVVFPELIRWSALADLIQTSNLQALYVQQGARYSDFSVGRFQMKPSFVETLEADFNKLLAPDEQRSIRGGRFEAGDTVEIRRARVRRLADADDQVRYLIIFFQVMERLYQKERWSSAEEKVRFYAAAYNSGYRSGAARIRREAGRNRFYLGLIPAKPFYNYADIAADYWRRAPVTNPSSVR